MSSMATEIIQIGWLLLKKRMAAELVARLWAFRGIYSDFPIPSRLFYSRLTFSVFYKRVTTVTHFMSIQKTSFATGI